MDSLLCLALLMYSYDFCFNHHSCSWSLISFGFSFCPLAQSAHPCWPRPDNTHQPLGKESTTKTSFPQETQECSPPAASSRTSTGQQLRASWPAAAPRKTCSEGVKAAERTITSSLPVLKDGCQVEIKARYIVTSPTYSGFPLFTTLSLKSHSYSINGTKIMASNFRSVQKPGRMREVNQCKGAEK